MENSRNFFQIMREKQSQLFVSSIVIKELSFKLNKEFERIIIFFRSYEYIEIIRTAPEDYVLARKIESFHEYKIGFCDCLHIAICKRLGACLVTRDKDLISIAHNYINADKPENLIN